MNRTGAVRSFTRFRAVAGADPISRARLALGLEVVLGAAVVIAAGLPALLLADRIELLALGVVNLHPRPLVTAAGLATALLLFVACARRPGFRFAHTLNHELAHVVAATLLGGRPRRLEASDSGSGATELDLRGPLRRLRGFLVAIAPYWFSPLLGTASSAAVSLSSSLGGRFVAAMVLGWALCSPLADADPRQPDLRRYGVAIPLAAALWLWAAAAAGGLALLSSGRFASIGSLYRAGWSTLAGWLS